MTVMPAAVHIFDRRDHGLDGVVGLANEHDDTAPFIGLDGGVDTSRSREDIAERFNVVVGHGPADLEVEPVGVHASRSFSCGHLRSALLIFAASCSGTFGVP